MQVADAALPVDTLEDMASQSRKLEQQQEWRRKRLAELVKEKFGGNETELGRAMGYKDGAFVRQMLADPQVSAAARKITEKTIAKIESLRGLAGWFAQAQAQAPSQGVNIYTTRSGGLQPHSRALTNWPTGRPVGAVVLAATDVRASMGVGADQPTENEVVSQMVVDETWLRRNCTFSAAENLALITGVGDSMRPTFEDGDALLVDRGVKEIKVDAVYCVALNEELYVKRLQRRPDGTVLMISDNSAYEAYQVNPRKDRINILGRVVMTWNARRL